MGPPFSLSSADFGEIRLLRQGILMSFFDILTPTRGYVAVAGAPKKPRTKPLRMTVSVQLHAYLGWLSRNTLLGKSENDVAAYLLTQRLEQMRQAAYREEGLVDSDS